MGDYQFYQLTPEGKQAEERRAMPPHRPPLLPWVFLTVVVALIVLVMVFAVNVVKQRGGRVGQTNRIETQVEDRISECLEGGGESVACRDTAQTEVADTQNDPKLCKQLSGEVKVNCVTVIAFKMLDPKMCATLSGDEKGACEDLVYSRIARVEEDRSVCEKIVNEASKTICQNDFYTPSDALLKAIDEKSLSACQALATEDERMACIDVLQTTDSDGDGYSDYDEVQNGFNPFE